MKPYNPVAKENINELLIQDTCISTRVVLVRPQSKLGNTLLLFTAPPSRQFKFTQKNTRLHDQTGPVL